MRSSVTRHCAGALITGLPPSTRCDAATVSVGIPQTTAPPHHQQWQHAAASSGCSCTSLSRRWAGTCATGSRRSAARAALSPPSWWRWPRPQPPGQTGHLVSAAPWSSQCQTGSTRWQSAHSHMHRGCSGASKQVRKASKSKRPSAVGGTIEYHGPVNAKLQRRKDAVSVQRAHSGC
jgi:hypothetical protein